MKKIGILTFHRAMNNGAVLQAYALKKVISKLGVQCDILDYRNKQIEDAYKIRFFDSMSPRVIARGFFTYPRRWKKVLKFENFRNNYLTPHVTDIHTVEDEYDKFITGSDQVWNYEITGFDKTYFLDFITDKKKKNSYAASFGISEIPEKFQSEYVKLLSGFNKISVREKQGVKIINDLLHQNAEIVLDPTMLMIEKDWDMIPTNENYGKDYILIYHLLYSQSLIEFAKKLSVITGRKIVYICDDLRRKFDVEYAACVSPVDFINLIRNSEYIVTNSFHGMAFAIVLNKTFFVEMLPPPVKTNSRIENLIDMFDLQNRLISENNDISCEIINFDNLNQILNSKQNSSINYLKSIIDD